MIPGGLIPGPEPLPLPAPAWVFWALLMLTSFLHVLAMNVLVGGSLLSLYLRLRRWSDPRARALLVRLARPAPVVAAATITLGVAPLLFLQVLYGRLFFVSSILMAWAWLAIVPALIAVYYATYAAAYRARRQAILSGWLYLVTGILLLAVAFLYTTNMTLMLGADRFAALYGESGRGLHLNMGEPTLWPRWLHMILGGVAVAGLAIVFAARRWSTEPELSIWAQRFGAASSALATAVNMVVGFWWTVTLPLETIDGLLGANKGAAAMFALSVAASVVTLVLLMRLVRSELFSTPAAISRTAAAALAGMLATVLTMLLVRDGVRAAALERAGFVQTTWVVTQWGPLVLFVVLLLVALGAIAWMVMALMRSAPSPESVVN
jgi:hypothetical protein